MKYELTTGMNDNVVGTFEIKESEIIYTNGGTPFDKFKDFIDRLKLVHAGIEHLPSCQELDNIFDTVKPYLINPLITIDSPALTIPEIKRQVEEGIRRFRNF